MTIRTFWLNLGWLVVLVVTVAVPLTLDAVGRLTYFTSLVLWGIPILYLWPVFGLITADGTGRRRRALRWTAGTIVVLGIVLDFLLGFLTLRFPGCSEPAGASPYVWCLPAVRWQDPGRGASVLRDGPRGHRPRVRMCRRALVQPLQPQR